MIRNMRAKNFKSWADTGDIRVAPITGFFGTNSSGKTSLLQMLLLLKQTAQSSDPKQVLFFGDENSLINIGSFYDSVHMHRTDLPIEFSMDWNESHMRRAVMLPSERVSFTTSILEKSDRLVVNFFRYKFGDHSLEMRLSDSDGQYKIVTNEMNYEMFDADHTRRALIPGKFYIPPRGVIAWTKGEERTYFIIDYVLEQLLSNINYLGPLREYPKRNYLWGGDAPSDVGRRGERAIAALLSAREEGRKNSLEGKVAYWLKKMGLIHSFNLRPIARGRRDYEVVVKKTRSSTEALITDIGFGISQILPVIVLCYYVPEGSIVILEQPELHLHPSVQADLADLFIDVAKKRKVQIIFESHSEYLLHRLQRRIAEEKLKNEDTALYFCSMEAKASKIEELKLDEYGNIANWPKDFFGDVTSDLIAMTEAAMKRKLAEQT